MVWSDFPPLGPTTALVITKPIKINSGAAHSPVARNARVRFMKDHRWSEAVRSPYVRRRTDRRFADARLVTDRRISRLFPTSIVLAHRSSKTRPPTRQRRSTLDKRTCTQRKVGALRRCCGTVLESGTWRRRRAARTRGDVERRRAGPVLGSRRAVQAVTATADTATAVRRTFAAPVGNPARANG